MIRRVMVEETSISSSLETNVKDQVFEPCGQRKYSQITPSGHLYRQHVTKQTERSLCPLQ